jgi:hypothetical protein
MVMEILVKFYCILECLYGCKSGAAKLLHSLACCSHWIDELSVSLAEEIVTKVIQGMPKVGKRNTHIKCACVIIGLLLPKVKGTKRYNSTAKNAKECLSPWTGKPALVPLVTYVKSVIDALETGASFMPQAPPITTYDQDSNEAAPSGPLQEGYHNGEYYGVARSRTER